MMRSQCLTFETFDFVVAQNSSRKNKDFSYEYLWLEMNCILDCNSLLLAEQ